MSFGGAARSAELTQPGFVHDVCSSVYPMALASPFFRSLPLADHGLEWVQPPLPFTHPLDGGKVAVQDAWSQDGPQEEARDAQAELGWTIDPRQAAIAFASCGAGG